MDVEVEDLLYETFSKIQGNKYSDELVFFVDDKPRFKMYHSQDCCEQVQVEEIVGDLQDLVDSPILEAECVTSYEVEVADQKDDENMWTFYKLGTAKGHVTLRWLGSSNGYYSVAVSIDDLSRNWKGEKI